MLLGLLICFVYAVFCWPVFFKFRWIQFSITWGVVSHPNSAGTATK